MGGGTGEQVRKKEGNKRGDRGRTWSAKPRGCGVVFSLEPDGTHREKNTIITEGGSVLISCDPPCSPTDTSYLDFWDSQSHHPCSFPNPANSSDPSTPPPPSCLESPVVAIMGDSCGLSILLDCQAEQSRRPDRRISGSLIARVSELKERREALLTTHTHIHTHTEKVC